MLYAVSWTQYAVSCILYAVSCMLYSVFCVLHAVCCILYAACGMLYVVWCILYSASGNLNRCAFSKPGGPPRSVCPHTILMPLIEACFKRNMMHRGYYCRKAWSILLYFTTWARPLRALVAATYCIGHLYWYFSVSEFFPTILPWQIAGWPLTFMTCVKSRACWWELCELEGSCWAPCLFD